MTSPKLMLAKSRGGAEAPRLSQKKKQKKQIACKSAMYVRSPIVLGYDMISSETQFKIT